MAVFGVIALVVFVVFAFRFDVPKKSQSMQLYEYDNGQGTVFDLQFYKNAKIVPAIERKISFDAENPPKGNIITQSDQQANLTFAIGKTNEIDDSAREYCSNPERNIALFKSKKTGNEIPICLLGSGNKAAPHAFYLTQVESSEGRHLVQIFKDFDSDAKADDLSEEVDLRKYTKDIIYILSSIEERRK